MMKQDLLCYRTTLSAHYHQGRQVGTQVDILRPDWFQEYTSFTRNDLRDFAKRYTPTNTVSSVGTVDSRDDTATETSGLGDIRDDVSIDTQRTSCEEEFPLFGAAVKQQPAITRRRLSLAELSKATPTEKFSERLASYLGNYCSIDACPMYIKDSQLEDDIEVHVVGISGGNILGPTLTKLE